MLYIFLLQHDPAVPFEPDVLDRHFAFAAEARANGAYVYSEALGGGESATTVRVRGERAIITDGPFAETKEVFGGFYVLDCKDLDEALEYAAKMPDAVSGSTEVRPVVGVPGWHYSIAADRERLPLGA